MTTSRTLVKSILDAYLSSQEESIFGGLLERLAIFVCKTAYEGKKSSAEGIDLEFEKNGIRYIVSVKSGPNWGNSSQIKKMRDNFTKARRIMGANVSQSNVVAINGCCYGKEDRFDKGDYLKLCGKRFWELISGDENLYTEIIEPIGRSAKQHNEKFNEEYVKVIDRFANAFASEYCDSSGNILWKKLTKYTSGS